MEGVSMLMNAIWAGLFASGLGVLLTTPHQGLVACFACGLTGRLVRNLLIAGGLSQTVSVAVATVVCVLVTSLALRRSQLSPLVMVTGVLPLAPAVALFKSIYGLLTLPTVADNALTEPAVQLIANLSTVFATILAIVLGLRLGLFIVVALGRKDLLLGS